MRKNNSRLKEYKKTRSNLVFLNNLLLETSGFIYNYEKIQNKITQIRNGIDDSEVNRYSDFFDTAMKMFPSTDDSRWIPLNESEETMMDDNSEDWHALFYYENKNDSNIDGIEIAENRGNQTFSFGDIISKNSSFFHFTEVTKKCHKKVYEPYDFFKPFEHLSPFYICYDPYLLGGGNEFFGYKDFAKIIDPGDSKFELNEKVDLFSLKKTNKDLEESGNEVAKYEKVYELIDKLNYQILNHICLYVEWIYRVFQKSNSQELPTIYLASRIWNNNESLKDERESIFLQNILDSENLELEVFKKFVKDDKIKFIYVDKSEYEANRTLLHENNILTDYGYISWKMRKDLFDRNIYGKNKFIHSTLDETRMDIENIFNLFKSVEVDKYNFEKTDFSKSLNFWGEKIKKLAKMKL
jgi:hypothetical protein